MIAMHIIGVGLPCTSDFKNCILITKGYSNSRWKLLTSVPDYKQQQYVFQTLKIYYVTTYVHISTYHWHKCLLIQLYNYVLCEKAGLAYLAPNTNKISLKQDKSHDKSHDVPPLPRPDLDRGINVSSFTISMTCVCVCVCVCMCLWCVCVYVGWIA